MSSHAIKSIVDQIMKFFSTNQMNSIFGSIDLKKLIVKITLYSASVYVKSNNVFQSKNFSNWQISELAIYVRNFFKYYVKASRKRKFCK